MTLPAAAPVQTMHQDLSVDFVEAALDRHHRGTVPRLTRLWDYYRNDMSPRPPRSLLDRRGRGYQLAQQQGLPPRLTQPTATALEDGVPAGEPERVIENDIAWRLHTLVDFMFGQPVVMHSQAGDPAQATRIDRLISKIFQQAGGLRFLQDLALIGAVYGYVDVLVRVDSNAPAPDPTAADAPALSLQIVDPLSGVPMMTPGDFRQLEGFALDQDLRLNELARPSLASTWRQRLLGQSGEELSQVRSRVTEIWTARSRYRLVGEPGKRQTVEQDVNRLGCVPVVHIQNLPQPFAYSGLSEVEPLIPLQDELNTRLSDRANRVTFQSFKMYLGKGIDGFLDRPVGPGQMWATDNPEASIAEFGGDADSPSESAHIREIRQAMDKASAVTPVAAGLLQAKVGNLTSENALRITLMGLLAKTQRKRQTYGRGLEQICQLILHAADVTGLLPNKPEDRRMRLDWPSPIPENEAEQLDNAKRKLDVGVPPGQVLRELGYDDESAAASFPPDR